MTTASYRVIADSGGNRYCFVCELTGALFYTNERYLAEDPQQELQRAWEAEGRKHFNRCHKCGRWVVDAGYNPIVLECVECAPFEYEARYCKSCGVRVRDGSRKCPSCGNSLYYKGVAAYDTSSEA